VNRNVLFILNPKAGKRKKLDFQELIASEMPGQLPYKVLVWSDKNDFSDAAAEIRSGRYTDIVAIGGDGTVNKTASLLVNTDLRLGILPAGSGNSLARSIGISMKPREAIRQIVEGLTAVIDHGEVNGIPFFCTSGLGFDAHIGEKFATSKKRGLRSYVAIVLSELFRYRARDYQLTINGNRFGRKAFLITVANSGQYGNDFYISPQASLRDGKFHVVIISRFNAIEVLPFFLKILLRKAHRSRFTETFITHGLTIARDAAGPAHYDGEPCVLEKSVTFINRPSSLRVICGRSFQNLAT
jgi:diacylglycerol kinase (ATP)